MSYTRLDDDYLEGGITWLRGALEKAVRVRTGFPFQIFQDVEDIQLGDRWSKKLDQAIAQAQLFIPILTPCFFQSEFCRRESQAFLAYEKKAGRDDLILPLYLLEAQVLKLPGLRKTDQLALEFGERQHADWQDLAVNLQHKNTRPLVAARIATLATAIARAVTKHHAATAPGEIPPGLKPKRLEPAEPREKAKLVEELKAIKAKLASVEKVREDELQYWREREAESEQAVKAALDEANIQRDAEIERQKELTKEKQRLKSALELGEQAASKLRKFEKENERLKVALEVAHQAISRSQELRSESERLHSTGEHSVDEPLRLSSVSPLKRFTPFTAGIALLLFGGGLICFGQVNFGKGNSDLKRRTLMQWD